MTYDQLITLDTIIREGSFKAAAASLNKTQPSISVSIKKLEEEFNFKFFSRDKYRPTLTENGKAFYQKSLDALCSLRELETFGKELSQGYESQINIFVEPIFPIDLISEYLKKINCNINIYVDLLDGLMHKIRSKEADIAIGSFSNKFSDISHIKIFEIEMIPVISSEYYEKYARSFSALKKFSQIIVRSSSINFDENIVGHIKQMKSSYTSDIATKKQLILCGNGWGRLPRHIIENELKNKKLKTISEINEIKEYKAPLYLMRNKNHILGPNAKKLWNMISKKEEA